MLKLAENGYTDILIYVLIMVAGLIANAYKNYAKKKETEKRAGRSAPEQKPIFPEVLFEPVFEYEEPEKEPEIFSDKKEVEILDLPQSSIDKPELESIPTPSYFEGEAAFENAKNTLNPDMPSDENKIESEDLTLVKFFEEQKDIEKSSFKFDVSQAVIYSEILKPKYF
jgi:hypothetical protein